jgi:hypothetical protein
MDDDLDQIEPVPAASARRTAPRFGSFLGLFYVAVIVGVLSWALSRDTGTTHAFESLKPGMTPTEVAALLGVPRAQTTEGSRVVQTWKIPDGQTFVVVYRDGKLVEKSKAVEARAPRSG